MGLIFNFEVDYDELVNELYVYLMEDDAIKLRNFQYRSSVYQWLKVLSIRYFIKRQAQMTDNKKLKPPYDVESQPTQTPSAARYDLERLP